jgi:type IV pilus assembly protein PilE
MIRKQQFGFTLTEVVVTVLIVSILAAVALPSYRKQAMRGDRAAAQAQMMDIANREQQFLLANRSYASKTTLEASGYSLPNEVAAKYTYSIAVGTGTVPSFTITFTPQGSQTSDGALTLDNQGVKTPADKW